ncbi:MAG: hypothetical protein V3V06_06655 [Dehalococcoidia bacterium]
MVLRINAQVFSSVVSPTQQTRLRSAVQSFARQASDSAVLGDQLALGRRLELAQATQEHNRLASQISALDKTQGLLQRMQELASAANKDGLTTSDRDSIAQQLAELNAEAQETFSRTLLSPISFPSLAAATATTLDSRSTARIGSTIAGLGLAALDVTGADAGATFVLQVGGALSKTVLHSSSTLRVGDTLDAHAVTTVDVSTAAAGRTFAFSTVNTQTVVVDPVSTVKLGAVFDSNTVTAIDVSSADANTTFTLSKTGTFKVTLTNDTTSQSQELNLAGVTNKAGDKVFNFDQLGVQFTLNGPAESSNGAIATALDGGTIVTMMGGQSTALRLTDQATGANQTIALDSIASTSGDKLINFNQLGIAVSLTGPAESSAGTLAQAFRNKTIVTARDHLSAEGDGSITLTNTATGDSQTLALDTSRAQTVLDFGQLGIVLSFDSASDADAPGAPLDGATIVTAERSEVRANEESRDGSTAGVSLEELAESVEDALSELGDRRQAVELRLTRLKESVTELSDNSVVREPGDFARLALADPELFLASQKDVSARAVLGLLDS